MYVVACIGFHAAVGCFVLVERHRSLIDARTGGVVVLHDGLPVQAVVPSVVVHQGKFAAFILHGVVEVGLADFSGTHVAVYHFVVHRQVRGSSEGKLAELLHTTVAHVDEGSRLSGVHVDGMAVAVVIDGSQFAAAFVVLLGEGELIDLCAVLERSRFDFERSRVEVLIDASAVVPVFGDVAVQVERKLLHTEVVALIVKCSVESFLSELGERVDGVTDVAGRDGRFRDFQQSHVAQAGVGAPQRVDGVRVGGISDGDTVFQYVDVGRGESDLDFARAVGTGGIQHDVTVTFFFTVRRIIVLGGSILFLRQRASTCQSQKHCGCTGLSENLFHTFFHGI